ncbi:MAG: hypothetical protein ABT00_17535 [Bordetella sp. SCN 68-11]|nr:MAG: hypothetical protein ABT00_17535 [Bordetella sp. SCN 68-11]OJW86032.1 MAG: hypothetical protein BGO71_11980 [Burkholderiales bacterium 67-32]
MDERAARDVVLAHALETTDDEHQLLRAEDRREASLSARNLCGLQGGRDAGRDPAGSFLQTRAALLLDGLERRAPTLKAMRHPPRLAPLASWLLPLAAFLAGALTERIANPHRMDLLSPPLLGVLGWNLLMYAILAASLVVPPLRQRGAALFARPWLPEGWRWRPRRGSPALAAAGARFALDWQRLAAPLHLARGKRILHLCAALFGAGVALSLYARGLTVEYRVGWESTFLDAGQVHAILSTLFAPATWLFRLPGFTPAEIAALRFDAPGFVAGGARWVHLYAALLAIVVVIPRLLLAAVARWKETHLRADFPLDMGLPYYRKLLGSLSPVPLRLRVIPYSFAVDAARGQALQAVARSMLGDTAQAAVMPGWDYGADPLDMPAPDAADEGATVTAALVNLSATPEAENHGAFLDHLARALPGKIVLAVDQSAYAARLDGQAGADRRLEERRRLWQDFGTLHKVPVTFVDLLHPPDA